MRNYHKLLELANNGVKLTISNRYTYSDEVWEINAYKTSDGVSFNIEKKFDDLDEGIAEVHSAWEQMTKAMPAHRLSQIEHKSSESNNDRDEATGQEITGRHDYEDDSEQAFIEELPFNRAP